jgi:hypothetical protein
MPTEFCIDQRGNIRTVGFSWRYFVRRIHETAFSRSYFAPLFYQDQNERQLRSPGRYNYHIFSGAISWMKDDNCSLSEFFSFAKQYCSVIHKDAKI